MVVLTLCNDPAWALPRSRAEAPSDSWEWPETVAGKDASQGEERNLPLLIDEQEESQDDRDDRDDRADWLILSKILNSMRK